MPINTFRQQRAVSAAWNRDRICECPETTDLGITGQTDRCKSYQDWMTLGGRFGRHILPLLGETCIFNSIYFSIQHIHHTAPSQGSNPAACVDGLCDWIHNLNMHLQEFWAQTFWDSAHLLNIKTQRACDLSNQGAAVDYQHQSMDVTIETVASVL